MLNKLVNNIHVIAAIIIVVVIIIPAGQEAIRY